MKLGYSEKEAKKSNPIDAGAHSAVCTQVIDLGLQREEYMGEVKEIKQIRIVWEVDEKGKDSDGKEYNRIHGETYTNSLGEKAKLRGILEGWRGKSFTEEELANFDTEQILGKDCTLNIKHKTSKSGNVYAIVDSISKFNEKLGKVDRQGELICFDKTNLSDEERITILAKLPKFIQEKILSAIDENNIKNDMVTLNEKEAMDLPF